MCHFASPTPFVHELHSSWDNLTNASTGDSPNSDYPAAQPLPETIRIRKDSAGATAQQSSGFVVDKTRNAVRIAADSQASQAGTEGKLSHQDPPNKSLTMEQQPKSRISSIPRQDWSIEDDNPTWHVPIPDGESYLEAATQCGDRPVGSIVSECSSDPVDSDGVHSWHSFPANHVLGSSHSLASTKISIEAAIENTEFIIKSLAPECETDRDDSHASDSWVWSKKDNSFPKRPKSHSYTKSPLSAAIERMEEEYLRNFPSGSSSKTSSSIDHKAPPPLLTPKKRTSSGSFTSTTRRRKNNSSTDLAKEGAGPLLKEASFPKAVPKVIVNWLSVKGISTWHASYKSAYVQKLAMGEEPVCASSIPGSYITGIDGVQKGRKSKYSENLQNRRAYKRSKPYRVRLQHTSYIEGANKRPI